MKSECFAVRVHADAYRQLSKVSEEYRLSYTRLMDAVIENFCKLPPDKQRAAILSPAPKKN